MSPAPPPARDGTAPSAAPATLPPGEASFRPAPDPEVRRRYRGCLLGGAVGDALGAPVEFMTLAEIRERFGDSGVVDFTTAFDRRGGITDDTQMTLFTAEGLLRAHVQEATTGTADAAKYVAYASEAAIVGQSATPRSFIRRNTSGVPSPPCSIVSTPASTAMRIASGPFACAATGRPLALPTITCAPCAAGRFQPSSISSPSTSAPAPS
jgi:ADP-ribosylglycohydrolase